MGPILIGGCPRSGTTLLRVMLDSHHEITCPPEAKLAGRLAFQWQETRQAVGGYLDDQLGVKPSTLAVAYGLVLRMVLDDARQRAGTRWVAEKTPNNALAFPALQHMLPDSPLVHVIRDGRDVVASLLRQDWRNLETGAPLPYTASAEAAARHRVKSVTTARKVRQGPGRERYVEIRYEALVTDPERTLTALCAALGIPFDPRMLAHHTRAHDLPRLEATSGEVSAPTNTGALGRWRTRLDRPARVAVAAVAGPLLRDLGYAADDAWVDAG
jgi:hypothetical protein